jgi:hypothetical protein
MDAEFKDDSVAGLNVARERSERSCVDISLISCCLCRARCQLSNGGLGLKIGDQEVADCRSQIRSILVAFWLCF